MRVPVLGGRLAVTVWDALKNSAAYPIEVAILGRVAGQRAADALRAPFALGDPDELTALFARAGITSPRIVTRKGGARFSSIRAMVEADLRGWLPVMGVVLPEEQIQQIMAEAERGLADYVTAAGEIAFDSPAHIIPGSRP